MLVVCEGLLITSIGLAIGVLAGVIGAYIIASKGLVIREPIEITIYAQPHVTPELILKTTAITETIGFLATLFPAYRASRIPPAQALRYE